MPLPLPGHTTMSTQLAITVHLPDPWDAAVERVRDALKSEGFGVLTEIDVRATFRAKLDREFRPYVILGACNPPLAWSALNSDPQVGLLLPCNVTVEAAEDGGSIVRLVDPTALLSAQAIEGAPSVEEVAADARERLERVAAALGSGEAE